MGKKCCVTGCRSGYEKTTAEKTSGTTDTEAVASGSNDDSNAGSSDSSVSAGKVSFHKFPDASKEPDLRHKWIRAIPREH